MSRDTYKYYNRHLIILKKCFDAGFYKVRTEPYMTDDFMVFAEICGDIAGTPEFKELINLPEFVRIENFNRNADMVFIIRNYI